MSGSPASRHKSPSLMTWLTWSGTPITAPATTAMVVLGVTSGENVPPSRSISTRASRFESTRSLPISATCCPVKGRWAWGVPTRSSVTMNRARCEVKRGGPNQFDVLPSTYGRFSQFLQHRHKRLGASIAAALCFERPEQLLNELGGKDRDVQFPRGLADETKVFLLQFDLERRREVAVEDLPAEILKSPTVARAAGQRVVQLVQV